MVLPQWLPFFIGALVIAFGALRLQIAFRKEPEEGQPNFRKGGYYAKSKRSHLRFGVSYLALGVFCIAMGLGYSVDLSGGCLHKQSSQDAPSEGGIPVKTIESSTTSK